MNPICFDPDRAVLDGSVTDEPTLCLIANVMEL